MHCVERARRYEVRAILQEASQRLQRRKLDSQVDAWHIRSAAATAAAAPSAFLRAFALAARIACISIAGTGGTIGDG
jgi:hypothetical protein